MSRQNEHRLTAATTRIIGVLSHPAGETPERRALAERASDALDEAAILGFGTILRDIAEPVEALRRLGSRGVLLAGRLREAGSGLVDRLADEAHGSGLSDIVTFDGEEAIGYNSEARTFVSLLEEHAEKFAGKSAVILGAGMVARGAAWALIRHFRVRRVAIAARDPQAARIVKTSILSPQTDSTVTTHELFPPDIADEIAEARLIINATPIGTDPEREETPITLPDIFGSHQIVLDVVRSGAITMHRTENDADDISNVTPGIVVTAEDDGQLKGFAG